MRRPVKNLLLLLALAAFSSYLAHNYPLMQKGIDFPHFYAAARMVYEGHGHDLYDSRIQDQFLARYAGRAGIYYNHPPFETLIYLPFAVWSPSHAYLLWCCFKLLLLIAIARSLAREAPATPNWRFQLLLFLVFVPVLLDFLQGQDSVFLLFFLVSTFVALKRRSEFVAGLLLACGLFKFNLVVPALIPLLFATTRRFAAGFISVGAFLAFLSIEISGVRFLVDYPRFLERLTNLPLGGVHPSQMANVRGLTVRLFPGMAPSHLAMTVAVSLLLLSLATQGWIAARKQPERATDLAFANVVLGAVLVSYHLSPHDLSILLLPMVLILNYVLTAKWILPWTRLAFIATLVVMFLPPLYLFLVRRHLYAYASLPVFILFGLTYAEINRRSVAADECKTV